MLDDDKIYKLIEPIIDIARQIEMELILSIAERIKINHKIGGTAYWQLKQLNEMGALHASSLKIIEEYTGKTSKELKKMIMDAQIDSIDMKSINKAYKSKLTTDPNLINFMPIIETYQDSIVKEVRVILTSAVTESNVMYQRMIDKVSLEVTGGVKSYDQAIQDALNELVDKGVTSTRYEGINKNGEPYVIEYPIESSIRRSAMTAVNQVANASNQLVIDELKPPQIAVSSHLGARNKGVGHVNHESWQGKVYDNDGEFEKVTGYGNNDNLGLAGFNCRHQMYPYWEGISPKPEDVNTEENNRIYELEQRQRLLESRVRNSRKRLEVAKLNGNSDHITKEKKLLDARLHKLDRLVTENNLTRQYNREHIAKAYKTLEEA